jgi:hypothetical protein
MGLAILLLSFDDEIVSEAVCSAFCIAVPWLATFGWILTFSAIFTKTNRVNKIFHNPQRLRRIKVTPWDVMKPFAFLLTVAGVVLIVWTAVSPPVWEREVSQVDIFSRDVETKGFCNYDESAPYAIILMIILLGTVALSLYEAFVARNISTEFAESDYIFVVLCVVFLVSFMGIPVMLIARDQPQARFFCSACILFVICVAVLLLIFCPKMVAHWRSSKLRLSSMMNSNVRMNGGAASGVNSDSNRNAPSIYGGRTHVSGLFSGSEMPRPADLPHSSEGSSFGPDSEVESLEEEGIQVLLHPKEVDGLKQTVHALKRENKILLASRRNLHTMLQESKRLLDVGSGDHQDVPPAPLSSNRSRSEASSLVKSEDEDLSSEDTHDIMVEEGKRNSPENSGQEKNVSSPALARNDTSASLDVEDVFDLDAGADEKAL